MLVRAEHTELAAVVSQRKAHSEQATWDDSVTPHFHNISYGLANEDHNSCLFLRLSARSNADPIWGHVLAVRPELGFLHKHDVIIRLIQESHKVLAHARAQATHIVEYTNAARFEAFAEGRGWLPFCVPVVSRFLLPIIDLNSVYLRRKSDPILFLNSFSFGVFCPNKFWSESERPPKKGSGAWFRSAERGSGEVSARGSGEPERGSGEVPERGSRVRFGEVPEWFLSEVLERLWSEVLERLRFWRFRERFRRSKVLERFQGCENWSKVLERFRSKVVPARGESEVPERLRGIPRGSGEVPDRFWQFWSEVPEGLERGSDRFRKSFGVRFWGEVFPAPGQAVPRRRVSCFPTPGKIEDLKKNT